MSHKVTGNKQTKTTDKIERGRKSYEEGHSFEKKVGELYRLLHYEVELGRLFDGRQVDLFLTGRFGDLTVHRAIECKLGPVQADHIDTFIAKLRLVRGDYAAAQGTIISAVSFTEAIKSQAFREGIQLTLYRDLAAQLLDGHGYAQSLLRDCESSDRYPIPFFVEPFIGYDITGESIPAFKVISEWLVDGDWNQLTLLGDVGTGKSFLSRMIAHHLATAFLARPLESPLPILIDLRNADRQFSLEGLILTHLANSGLARVSFEAFQHSLWEGNIVLILDGFDEMAARVTPHVTTRNFHELARSVEGRAKVLLTCRTHYFKSRTEEEEVILGVRQDYGSETARDLYWELIARKGFKIAYLRPFELPQIEEYVRRIKPKTAKQALHKIQCTYNLMELSQRPMLLEMIVKSIDKLKAREINPATLYMVYTDAWIHRDQWRDVLSPDAKLSLLMALAHSLRHEDVVTIHHTRLAEYLNQELAAQVQNVQHLLELDNEIRTASFLTRDDAGNYGFAHKSYAEFFTARYLAHHLKTGTVDCLHTKRLTTEIISFLKHMVDPAQVEPLLEKIICEDYRPLISENALLCLYGFRRESFVDNQDASKDKASQPLRVLLPSNAKLQGAQLDQVTLEGAVLQFADLSGANLSQAILARADISNARLDGANLEKADLLQVRMHSAVMSMSILRGANLEGADLSAADLRGANISDAFLLNITYKDADFTDAKFKGTILPEELTAVLERTSEEEFQTFLETNNLLTNEYWPMIEQLRPALLRIAGAMSLTADFDNEDIVSDVSLLLLKPQTFERLMKLNERDREAYIVGATKNLVKSHLRKRRKELTFSGFATQDGSDEDIDTPLGDHDGIRIEFATQDGSDEDIDPSSHRFRNSASFLATQGGSDEDIDSYINAIADGKSDPLEKLIASETKEVSLAEIQSTLSPETWRLVKALYIDGRKLQDIAFTEGISIKTAQRYLIKGLELVRRRLHEHD